VYHGRGRRDRIRPYQAIGNDAASQDVPGTSVDQAGRSHPVYVPPRLSASLRKSAAGVGEGAGHEWRSRRHVEFIIPEEQQHKCYKTFSFAKYCRKCSRFRGGRIEMPRAPGGACRDGCRRALPSGLIRNALRSCCAWLRVESQDFCGLWRCCGLGRCTGWVGFWAAGGPIDMSAHPTGSLIGNEA
jgi:hypothetical protein